MSRPQFWDLQGIGRYANLIKTKSSKYVRQEDEGKAILTIPTLERTLDFIDQKMWYWLRYRSYLSSTGYKKLYV